MYVSDAGGIPRFPLWANRPSARVIPGTATGTGADKTPRPDQGPQRLRTAQAIVIAEGYATAGSISDAIGHATVAAFDSGNLMAVATVLKDKYPGKSVLIAGDDDRHLLNHPQGGQTPDARKRKRRRSPWGQSRVPCLRSRRAGKGYGRFYGLQ